MTANTGPATGRKLTPQEAVTKYENLMGHWRRMMRHDLAEAERHSAEWEARREGIRERDKHLDHVQQRQNVINDQELGDLMAAYNFFRDRHDMYASHIIAETSLHPRHPA